jgi:hypothetical protein
LNSRACRSLLPTMGAEVFMAAKLPNGRVNDGVAG